MRLRQFGILTLAVLTAVAPVGCRRWHRRCDPPVRDDTLPADRDLDPGVIPPRGSTIPSPGLPSRPETGRRDTFTPTRPAPRLEAPVEPYGTWSGEPRPLYDLPRPTEAESRKVYEPTPLTPTPTPAKKPEVSPAKPAPEEPAKPKRLVLVPDQMPDSADKVKDTPAESKYTPTMENGRPVPDGGVFKEPVGPDGAFPKPDPKPPAAEPDPLRREAKASPKPDTPAAGIPDFQKVNGKPGVASGRKPVAEGYDWLAKSGYRTFVFAHAPTADVTATKALCEAAGMKFVGVPTAPDTIPAATAAFDAALLGAKDGPVYTCDDSGLRAATLWYAHFRTADLIAPDTAKVRAAGLGLGDTDANPDQKKLWDAVQTHLEKK